MKHLLVTLMLLLSALQGAQLSSIPLPKVVIINTMPGDYDDADLQALAEEGKIFTFLSHASESSEESVQGLYEKFAMMLGLHMRQERFFDAYRVAFIVPYRVIGPYAGAIMHAATAYFLTRDRPFELIMFPIEEESESGYTRAMQTIDEEGFDLAIAPVTVKGAQILCDASYRTKLFIPTLHKRRLQCNAESIYFGGINYHEQEALLSGYVKLDDNVSAVADGSPLSLELSMHLEQFVDVKTNLVAEQSQDLSNMMRTHPDLNQSVLFLNAPVLKSSLFLSQMTLADYEPSKILSTQLNYTPLLLTLTQYHDRQNMIIANSIDQTDEKLVRNAELLGSQLRFDWLSYATLGGMDFFYALRSEDERYFKESFVEGSLAYNVQFVSPGLYRLIPAEPPLVEPNYPQEISVEEPLIYSPLPDTETIE